MIQKIKNFIVKHTAALLIGILIASMLAITAGMIQSIKNNLDRINIIRPAEYDTEDDIPVIATGAEYAEQYIVKEYDGRIGVYIPGDTVPSRVIQVYVAYLPEIDRAKLRTGIVVDGRRALENLLDDFRS